MNTVSPRCWTLFAVLIAVSVVGCSGSDGLPRKAIRGEIVGAEGRNGTLTLIPAEGAKGPAATTAIEDGEYEFTKRTGPIPGNYVAIVRLGNVPNGLMPDAWALGGKPLDPLKPRDALASLHEPDRLVTLLVPQSSSLDVPLVLAASR